MGWGRMLATRVFLPFDDEPWGFDNGAWSDFVRGVRFCEVAYMKRLWRAYAFGRPYLSVVPDLVGKGLESLEYSLWWRPRLPGSWPWYLALQDGMGVDDVVPVLKQFEGLFLGGTKEFKAQGQIWCNLAHQHGKRFHYGRCGTPQAIALAKRIGADSIDSTTCVYNEKRWDDFVRGVSGEKEQLEMKI